MIQFLQNKFLKFEFPAFWNSQNMWLFENGMRIKANYSWFYEDLCFVQPIEGRLLMKTVLHWRLHVLSLFQDRQNPILKFFHPSVPRMILRNRTLSRICRALGRVIGGRSWKENGDKGGLKMVLFLIWFCGWIDTWFCYILRAFISID